MAGERVHPLTGGTICTADEPVVFVMTAEQSARLRPAARRPRDRTLTPAPAQTRRSPEPRTGSSVRKEHITHVPLVEDDHLLVHRAHKVGAGVSVGGG
ncbi:unnamed protein product [Lota lota]